jgi:hypothetical protein
MKLNSQEPKITTGFNNPLPTLGPRLQKINPETMQLIKVYESVTEAMKENTNIKRPSINKAIVENTIYCGYRWLLVDRDLDPMYNRIDFLNEVLDSSIMTNEEEEQYEICSVLLDCKKQLNFE